MSVISIIVLLISIVLHELAHAVVADRFGDDTARKLGRITLNPIKHMDLLGSVILPATLLLTGAPFFIGWAKPVPVNPSRFSNPYRDMMWVAFAGPLTNFTLAFLSSVGLDIIRQTTATPATYWIAVFLISSIKINIILAIFNLIPIPPLDGSKILTYFLPDRLKFSYIRLEKFGFVALFLLVYIGAISVILNIFALPLIRWLL